MSGILRERSLNSTLTSLTVHIFWIFLVMTMLTGGCSSRDRDPSTLLSNFYEYPLSFDPRKSYEPISYTVLYMLFEGLTRLNVDGEIEMAQANSVDVSEDGRIYTFHLGEHRWTNGDKVTAFDFAESWRDLLNPKFPSYNAHLLYPIKNAALAKQGKVSLEEIGIEVLDARTLRVELEEPTPYFLYVTSHSSLYPINHSHEKSHPNWAQSDGDQYVCNGPFYLKRAVVNQEVVFAKNRHYKGKNKAKLKEIIFSIIASDTAALQLFAVGGLDLITMPLTPIPLTHIRPLRESGMLGSVPIAANLFLGFNTSQFPFQNANLRKAFSYAIDRDAIVEHVSQLGEEVATHAIPSILRHGEKIDFFKDGDVRLARELLQKALDELGMKPWELKGIQFYTYPLELTQTILQVLQEQWKKNLNVEVEIKVLPFKTLMDKVRKEEFHIGLFAWLAEYCDPMSFFARYLSKDDPKNYARWENPDFTRLLVESSRIQDSQKRLDVLKEAEAIFMDQMPIAPIYHWRFPYLIKPYVKGFTISPLGQIQFNEVSIDAKQFRELEGKNRTF